MSRQDISLLAIGESVRIAAPRVGYNNSASTLNELLEPPTVDVILTRVGEHSVTVVLA